MPTPRKIVKALAVAAAALVVVGILIRFWVVPSLVIARIEALTGGKATIGGFWINGRSSGVKGLTLRETLKADSPVWAEARAYGPTLALPISSEVPSRREGSGWNGRHSRYDSIRRAIGSPPSVPSARRRLAAHCRSSSPRGRRSPSIRRVVPRSWSRA